MKKLFRQFQEFLKKRNKAREIADIQYLANLTGYLTTRIQELREQFGSIHAVKNEIYRSSRDEYLGRISRTSFSSGCDDLHC